jgi:hypothetical protein
MAILKTSPLDERIRSIQAEASAGIDAYVLKTMEDIRKSSNTGECGIPQAVIRQGFMRGSNDVCSVYLRLKTAEDAGAAQAKGKAA